MRNYPSFVRNYPSYVLCCFRDEVRAPIPQTQEMLVDEAPAYGKHVTHFWKIKIVDVK